MNARTALCLSLVGVALIMIVSLSTANASLCQTVAVSSSYPHAAFPTQEIRVVTTVAGSCTSDGEDYFAARVDLVDRTSKLILATNSTVIGYNANNFSVHVDNAASTPPTNETWSIEVDTYLIQAGGTSGKYLLNSTTVTVQVGTTPIPEFQTNNSFILCVILTASTLTSFRVKYSKSH